VQIAEARSWLRGHAVTSWAPRPLDESRAWGRVVDVSTIRPGAVIVASTASGGYDPATGWDPKARGPVPPVPAGGARESDDVAPIDEATADDPASFSRAWVRLDDHLRDTRAEAIGLLAECRLPGLTDVQRAAVVRAAAVHDLGKVHDVFQATMRRSAGDELQHAVERLVPLAKSGGRPARHDRAYFRHELVSALLLSENHPLLGDAREERDLVRYLVAAHHGRVRLAIRSIPGEAAGGARVALGVVEGDVVGPCTIDGVELTDVTLRLDEMAIGEGSWTAKALALRDRDDLGPFRLATLEALVRLADWRASAAPSIAHALDLEGAAS
jgi:CRISPR-associated endonuclease/helicase Cas3